MTSGVQAERVPLSEYIAGLRDSATLLNCGYTHQALCDELQYQNCLEQKIDLIHDSPAGDESPVYEELHDITRIIDVNKQCLHYLGGITDLEDFYSDLTALNTKRALELVSQRMGTRFWKRKLSGKVKKAWDNIGRYSELLTMHVKNAADFHQFYYDARQIEVKLNERCAKFACEKERGHWENCEGSVIEARNLANQIKNDFQHMDHLSSRAYEILGRAGSIVPIHLRQARLKRPVKGIMLCDYETTFAKLSAGDTVFVLTNSGLGEEGSTEYSATTETSTTEYNPSIHTKSTTSEEIDDDSLAKTSRRPTDVQPTGRTLHAHFPSETTDSSAATDTASSASTSYLTNGSYQGISAAKLHWHVRTPDGRVDCRVPSVCVLLPAPDIDAHQRAVALNHVLLTAWKEIIDERLAISLEFFKCFLRRLCETDRVTAADDEAFRRLLQELRYSLMAPPTAENEDTKNKELIELVNAVQTHWEKTRNGEGTGGSEIHLKRTDISTFNNVLFWIKTHMQTNREYEQRLLSTSKFDQQADEIRIDHYRITEAIELLNEVVKKDREKVSELLKELQMWNRRHAWKVVPRGSPPPSSLSDWVTTSESDISDTDISLVDSGTSEAEMKTVLEKKHLTVTTKEYYPSMTYALPAIFTYNHGSCSEEASSDSSSIYEVNWEDGTKMLYRWRPYSGIESPDRASSSVSTTESEDIDLEQYILHSRDKSVPVDIAPQRESGPKRERKLYRSLRSLNASKLDSKYSVVYVEVARTPQQASGKEETEVGILDQKDKMVQVDTATRTPRVRKILEVKEEEDESSIRRSRRMTRTFAPKQKGKEVAVQSTIEKKHQETQTKIPSKQETSTEENLDIQEGEETVIKIKERAKEETMVKTEDEIKKETEEMGVTEYSETISSEKHKKYTQEQKVASQTQADKNVQSGLSSDDKETQTTPHQRPVEIVGDKVAVRAELIDAWCSASSSDFFDAHLAVLAESVLSKGVGVQTDVRARVERLEHVVDQASMCVSTSVGEYGSVIARAPIVEVDEGEAGVGAAFVPESELPVGEETTGVALSGERGRPAGVQASLIAVPVVEAAQHVLLETTSGVSQTVVGDVVDEAVLAKKAAGVGEMRVWRDRAPCVADVGVSYMYPEELARERAAHVSPPLIEACTTSVQKSVRDTDVWAEVGVSVPRPGYCSMCGQRVSEIVRRRDERTDEELLGEAEQAGVTESGVGVGVGDLPVHPERVDDGMGVVTLRRVDGTMQTGRVEALYVDADGTMVGVMVDGLDVTGVEGFPRIVIAPSIRPDAVVSGAVGEGDAVSPSSPDQRPVEIVGDKVAVRAELIDAWCSASSSDFFDAHLAVLAESVLSKGVGVQTDVRARVERLEHVVDQASMCVSTSVGEYGSVIARAPIVEVDEGEAGVGAAFVPESELPVGEETTGVALSGERGRPAGVQASLIAVPVVEAAQHVLLETTSGVSQTVVGDVVDEAVLAKKAAGVGEMRVWRDRAPCVADVGVSYMYPEELARERAAHVSPPLIEACTTSVQKSVRDTDVWAEVGVSVPRPGYCSMCGQRVSEIVRRRDERTDEELLGEAEQAGVTESGVGVGVGDLPVHPERVDDVVALVMHPGVDFAAQTLFASPLLVGSSCCSFGPLDLLSAFVIPHLVDSFCAHFIDTSDSFDRAAFSGAPAISEDISVDSIQLSRRRNFASQFSFFPEQYDAFSQTLPSMDVDISGSALRDLCCVSTSTDDLPSFSSLLLQSVSVTDFRELMVEHYYYAPAREPILVSDFSVQVSSSIPLPVSPMSWFEYLSSNELSMVRSTLLRYFNFDAYHAGLLSDRTREAACSAEDWNPEDGALYLSRLRSGLVAEVGLQAHCDVGLQEPITHSDFLEVLETFRSLSSNQQFYTARHRHGLLKDKACFKKEHPRCLADIGIQVESSVTISDFNLDSPEYRSGSPESTANTYENYLLRNRLGQICEQQSHVAPLVCPAATQTEAESFLRFSSMHEVPYESFETYERRLLRDEVAETFTQLDSETEITDDGRYDEKEVHDITEEITERNRKRIFSKVQITEELTDDTELVVCELGIQADLQHADAEPFTTLDTRPPSRASWTRARGNQTDPINLSALKSSSDFGWADPDLYAVILAGIAANRQRDYDSGGLSGDVGVGGTDRRTDFWAIQGRESPKIMITIGCQTSLLGIVPDREPMRWTDMPKPSQALLKTKRTDYGGEETLVRRLSFTSSQDSRESPTSLMIVQLRQRIIQYELFEARSSFPEASWNNIREVASPTTGLFAPVATALRRGWISLGDRNEYINPATGETMSLAAAYQLGRIRLASTPMSSQRSHEHAVSELLLIERTCFNWRKVRLVSIVDTARGDTLEPEAARDVGILEVTGNEIRFLDTMTNTWLTIEEGVGRQMIEVVDVETSADTSSTEEEEPASCRVFFLTQLCPGGEPSAWMSPMEAERFGLFNWETGDVAADWPARPLLSDSDPTGQWPLSAFVPTKWCSFLTARHAGWLRLVEEPDPSKWIITHSVPYQEPNAVLLSTQVNLVAYTSAQTTETTEDVQQRLLALNRARSEEVYPQQPPTSEDFATLHYSPQLPETDRSRSYKQVEIEETSNETYTVHRRQIHRRPYATSRQRYHSGGNPPSSDSISPKQLQRR